MRKGDRRLSICSIPDCGRDAIARNLCRRHYAKQWSNGTITENASINMQTGRNAKCLIEDCNDIVNSQGFCNKHYKRVLAHGNPFTVNTLRIQEGPCGAIGCGAVIESRNFCRKHYLQWWRTGLPYRQIAESGTWQPTVNGYMRGTVDGVRMYEHTYLAEKALGRKLPEDAEVHHMNGKKADNHTPFNLIICPDRAYHMLIEQRAREWMANAIEKHWSNTDQQ